MNRRNFIKTTTAATFASAAVPRNALATQSRPRGHAQAAILIWLGGGPAQTDTFDPKRLGDPEKNIAGSAYPAIDTAVHGVQVCEHLPRVAERLDRMTILRAVQHDVIDEHAAAVNEMHTGRPVSGTVVYPSIGSVISHQRGAQDSSAPSYVLCGYPSASRGPGFLGAKHSYIYVTNTKEGPAGLSTPHGISNDRFARRKDLLDKLRASSNADATSGPARDYSDAIDTSFNLATGPFSKAFELTSEPNNLRQRYGSEFGQRCLLARRLIQRGTRFVEVMHNLNFTNGTGWDTHKAGQEKQHHLIQDLDQAMGALTDDLQAQGMLDSTLIIVAGEFGRPAKFDGAGGRGHQSKTFSVLLAGGGLNHCGAFGETDEFSAHPITEPISVPDLHATIHAALGIDPTKNLYNGDRPVPITDGGTPIQSLLG